MSTARQVITLDGPLAGLHVVDLTQVLPGPYCAMLFADLGADVVKVEPPTGDVARLWGPHVRPGRTEPDGGYGGYFAGVQAGDDNSEKEQADL
jgi:crotonobetainyl-CoA:carnitine CoA-transferase CaiB-like acyl-CoA transferase